MSAQPAAPQPRQPRPVGRRRARPTLRVVGRDDVRPAPARAPAPAPAPAAPTPSDRAVRDVRRPVSRLAPSGPVQAWRRRLAVLVVVTGLVAGLVDAVVGSSAPPLVPVTTATVVVQPGETLWDVARGHAPAGTSLDAYVAQLRAANDLDGAGLQAWQVLRLPPA